MDDSRAWVATRKGLFELRRHGQRWQLARSHFLGEPVTLMLPPAPGRPALAALNLGHFGVKLHASDDAGNSWREVAPPVYPEQPPATAGPAWTLVQIWALESSAGRLWAGTLPGGLFSSSDGAQSWQLCESLWNQPGRGEWFGGGYDVPGIHSICPHPQQDGELLLGISCGGVWRSTDSGANWALRARGMNAAYMPPEQADNPNIQDPHRIVRCAGQPDVLWCQHHNGIWRSTDNGAQWHELKAPLSSFGFAVAAHPHEAGTAWFVPAESDQRRLPLQAALAVNRTRDGGASFDTLRHGLPQQDCYDIVYRHGLDVAADGRTLLMGSTTGGLWTSFDGGDRWQTVSLNLPPIAALRFG